MRRCYENELAWHQQRRTLIDSLELYDDKIPFHRVRKCARNRLMFDLDDPEATFSNQRVKGMMVSCLRHQDTNYDEVLDEMNEQYYHAPRDEKELTYKMIRNAILTKIAMSYPCLKRYCAQQKYPVPLYTVVN